VTNPKYNGVHQTTRARLVPVVAGGTVRCARGAACRYAEVVDGVMVGGLIRAGERWDLGHADHDSVGGPEHRYCNQTAPHRRDRRDYRDVAKHSRVW
jgi:hypothetical protein